MTNLSPYRLGNKFEYKANPRQKNIWTFVHKYLHHDLGCECAQIVMPDKSSALSVQMRDDFENAILKEITLEFLSELAREKGEILQIHFNRKDEISLWLLPNDDKWRIYFKDQDETLGEFALRVVKLRNYLS